MSPNKPTKEDARSTSSVEELLSDEAQLAKPSPYGGPSGRREMGAEGAANNRKHPPHVSENAEDAPVQDRRSGKGAQPVLPPNAQGQDELSVEEHSGTIDDESMYDRRPSEDKDRPPSSPRVP